MITSLGSPLTLQSAPFSTVLQTDKERLIEMVCGITKTVNRKARAWGQTLPVIITAWAHTVSTHGNSL